VKKYSQSRIVTFVPDDLKRLLIHVANLRGETISTLIRRALRRELALLNYLTDEEKKALGIMMPETEKVGNRGRKGSRG